MKKLIFLIIIFFSFSVFADLLKTVPQKESILTGEELLVNVETLPGKNMSARFVKENSDLAITGIEPSADGKSLVVKLIALKNGEFEVPEIELSLDGKTANTASFRITSQSRTQENDMNLRDIKETAKIMEKDYTILYAAGALVLAVILFILIRYLLRKFRRSKPVPVITATPFEIAMRFLKEAREKREIGDLESFVDMVTNGLRTYMSVKSGRNYAEMTTYEIRRELKKDALFSGYGQGITDVLKTGDRFKFADEQLSDSDLDMIYSGFENIVKGIEKSGVNTNAVS